MGITTITLLATALAGAKMPIRFTGMYVEGCSCSPPCACEITGVEGGCQGVGGFSISHGTFHGVDISGTKLAYATAPGQWVTCYVDAPSESKRKAMSALAKAAFGAWGKMGPVKMSTIAITGGSGKYRLTVDSGKVMALSTEPFYGVDKSKPITYSNINSVMHPVVMQAKTVGCTYHDDGRTFTLKGSNAYYNASMNVHGQLTL